MLYISIDGDDIGRKISSFYLSNSVEELQLLSKSLEKSVREVEQLLTTEGFSVIFCAADGVVAATKQVSDPEVLFNRISNLAPNGCTFSAGIGASLREAYIALLSAKSNGKACMHSYPHLGEASDR